MSFVDVAIIGAGPVGLAAALEAERFGLSGVVFEARRPAASIERFPARMPFFSEARKIEIGGFLMAVLGAKPTREGALLYYRRLPERLRVPGEGEPMVRYGYRDALEHWGSASW